MTFEEFSNKRKARDDFALWSNERKTGQADRLGVTATPLQAFNFPDGQKAETQLGFRTGTELAVNKVTESPLAETASPAYTNNWNI